MHKVTFTHLSLLIRATRPNNFFAVQPAVSLAKNAIGDMCDSRFHHGSRLRFAHGMLFMFIPLLLVFRFFRPLFNLSNQLCLGGLSCFHESFHVCVFPRVCFAACAATAWAERELLNFSEYAMLLGQLFILHIDAPL